MHGSLDTASWFGVVAIGQSEAECYTKAHGRGTPALRCYTAGERWVVEMML